MGAGAEMMLAEEFASERNENDGAGQALLLLIACIQLSTHMQVYIS